MVIKYCLRNIHYRHQKADTSKTGKITCNVTLWPVRNFAVPHVRNFGDIFVINIRSEITDKYWDVSMETQRCVLFYVFRLFEQLLEMQTDGSYI